MTLKELIRKYEPKVLALVETKVSGVIADNVYRKVDFRRMHTAVALGFSGGIWVLWRDNRISLNIIEENLQFITLEVCCNDSNEWAFSTIYLAPKSHEGKIYGRNWGIMLSLQCIHGNLGMISMKQCS